MTNQHGGDIAEICSINSLDPATALDFSANINPLGYPLDIEESVHANINTILHYPDPHCRRLRKRLADKYHCSESNIVVGNGSTELFYLIPRAVPAQQGMVFQPTFTEFTRSLKCARIPVKNIVCNDNNLFRIDLKRVDGRDSGQHEHMPGRLPDSYTNIIFICNPNNPTGHLTRREDILDLAGDMPTSLVVVDEAFMEFVTDSDRFSVMQSAAEIENLIVVRSLTKLYGIPGIRLGFLVAHRNIVKLLLSYKEPWSVNSIAQSIGDAALRDGDFVIRSREYTARERRFLYRELSAVNGLAPFEPSVNFILVKIVKEGMTASTLFDRLIKSGIIIRDCTNFVSLSDKYIRLAVRRREENVRLLDAIRASTA